MPPMQDGHMGIQLSDDSIKAGLAYCRWLHMRQFNGWLNKRLIVAPRAKDDYVLLNSYGKRVYELVLRTLKESNAFRGAVMMPEGERKAVVQYLCDLKDGKIANAGARGPLKHAKLHLSSIQKFMSGGLRTIRGLANSGQTDRLGDIVVPRGGRWELPVPLLWQHKYDQPIGWVRQIEVRSDGLWITAELASGIGKADEAWKMIESGLVTSYSIGFSAEDWEPLPDGGKKFTSWTLLEISVVTVPADPKAKISRRAKSVDGVADHPGSVRLAGRRAHG